MSKKKPLPRFTVGQQVFVKPGLKDADFPDLPIGGWSGSIIEVDRRDNYCLIKLDARTLASIHPVYKKRCERDGLGFEEMWLGEDDLERLTGDPPPIEQPINIVTPPLSEDDQEDRIRAVFGLTHDDLVPGVSSETLAKYHAYLAAHLTFPFEAGVTPEYDLRSPASVVGLLDPEEYEDAESDGLLCHVKGRGGLLVATLDELKVAKNTANGRLVNDYSYWFWNWR